MMKQAKLETQARLPAPARPLATPTMSDSAMPTLKKRSGNFLAKKSVRVELCTSPSTTTTSGWVSPSLASASPNASRTDLPSFIFPPPAPSVVVVRLEELVVDLAAEHEQHAELADRERDDEVDEVAQGDEEHDDGDAGAEHRHDERHDDQGRPDDRREEEVDDDVEGLRRHQRLVDVEAELAQVQL